MEFESRYKIDKERLSKYYERIKNHGKEKGSIDHITNFLINQSISSSFEEVFDTLKYYEDKIVEGQGLLDLAFEWIRAQKIRLEYKKYLIRAQYSTNDLCLAVDDCIYRFFLSYDEYIRNLFKKDIREHNFSALYEIFFNTFDEKSLIIEDIVQKHIHNIPSHYYGSNKINTNIMTLRQGLSNIIVKDYVNVLSARKEEEVLNMNPIPKRIDHAYQFADEFDGSNLERIIKTYCFNKLEITLKVIESSVSSFLSSFFRFGIFYKYDEFKDNLIQFLAEYLNSGLTGKLKDTYSVENLKRSISSMLIDSKEKIANNKLDGSAWIIDLKPILKEFVKEFVNNLFE